MDYSYYDELMVLDAPESIISYIVAVVVAAPLIQFISDWFKNKDKKKRRSIWINFLRSNEIIDKCLLTFENIKDGEEVEGWWFSNSRIIGIFIGIPSIILLSIIINYLQRNIWLSVSYSILFDSLVSYISIIIFARYLKKFKSEGRNEEDLIKESINPHSVPFHFTLH